MRLLVGFLVIVILAAALLTGLGYVARNLKSQLLDQNTPPTDEAEAPSPEASLNDNAEEPPAESEADRAALEALIKEITATNVAKLVKYTIDGESDIPSSAGVGSASVRIDYRLFNDTPYNLRGVVLTVTLISVGGQTREEHLQDPRWIEADTVNKEHCELKYSPSARGIPLLQMRVKSAYLKPADAEKLAEEHPEDWRDQLAKWEWRPTPPQ